MALETLTGDNDWDDNTGALTSDTLFQCQSGTVVISWESGPTTFPDGMQLAKGQSVIVPAGETVYFGALNSSPAVLFYAEFSA